MASQKGGPDGDTEVDVENHVENAVGGGGDGALLADKLATNKTISPSTKETLTAMNKHIQQLRAQYANLVKLCKNISCYSRYCNVTPSPSTAVGATKNNTPLTNTKNLACNCYSPLCMQKVRIKSELIALLRKANALNNNQSLSLAVNTSSPSNTVKMEITEESKDTTKRDLESATALATQCSEHAATIVERKPKLVTNESPPTKKLKIDSDAEKAVVDVTTTTTTTTTTSNISVTTTTTTTTTSMKSANGAVLQQERSTTHNSVTVSSTESNTISNTTGSNGLKKKVIVNRRGRTVQRCAYRKELNADGSEKIYTATSTQGKVYLKKMALTDRKKKRTPVKYPLCSTFCTKNKHRSILLLPQHELRKLSRLGGRMPVQGFHHQAKANLSVWPYPCPRPLFKTCWLYRTVGLKSLAAAAIQLRILWACLRWDDMVAKPLSADGKSQITTDTELVTLEILEHRHVGQFLDRTQYMRRKVVIPLELPKQVRGN